MKDETELFKNPWVRITLEAAGRVVRIQRTAERMTIEGLGTLENTGTQLVPLSGRARLRVLLDTRLAPLLADDEIERRLAPSTEVLLDGFGRRAVLVSTAVGRLQASRFSRLGGSTIAVFDSEAEALAFLLA